MSNGYIEKNVKREIKRFEGFSDGTGLPRSKGDKLRFRWFEDSYPTGNIAAIPYQLATFHGESQEKARELFVEGRTQMDTISPNEFLNSIVIDAKPVKNGTRELTVIYTVVQVELEVRRNRTIFQNLKFGELDDERADEAAAWIRKVYLNRPKFNKARDIALAHAQRLPEISEDAAVGSSAVLDLETDVRDLLQTGDYHISFNRNPLTLKQSDYQKDTEFARRRGPFYHWAAFTQS